MNKADARKEFLARWIPYGVNLHNRAEALGVDWRGLSMEKLEAAIIFAEEQATPEEYQYNPFITNQRINHVR